MAVNIKYIRCVLRLFLLFPIAFCMNRIWTFSNFARLIAWAWVCVFVIVMKPNSIQFFEMYRIHLKRIQMILIELLHRMWANQFCQWFCSYPFERCRCHWEHQIRPVIPNGVDECNDNWENAMSPSYESIHYPKNEIQFVFKDIYDRFFVSKNNI